MSSVEAAAWREPLRRLAGRPDDEVEATVVVEQGGPVHLGRGRDEEIDRGGPAVVAGLCEQGLDVLCPPEDRRPQIEIGECRELLGEQLVATDVSRRPEQLESKWCAGRDRADSGDAPSRLPRRRRYACSYPGADRRSPRYTPPTHAAASRIGQGATADAAAAPSPSLSTERLFCSPTRRADETNGPG